MPSPWDHKILFDPDAGSNDPMAGFRGDGVPQLGTGTNKFFSQRIALDALRANEEFNGLRGSFIWINDASSLNAKITVKFDDQTAEGIAIKQGVVMRGFAFGKIYISNTAQIGEWVDVVTAMQGPPYGLDVVNAAASFTAITGTVITSPRATCATPADVSLVHAATTLIVAADATRQRAIVSNPSTNAVEFRVGYGATVGAARGISIPPGQSREFNGTAAIYGFNPDAALDYPVSVTTEAA